MLVEFGRQTREFHPWKPEKEQCQREICVLRWRSMNSHCYSSSPLNVSATLEYESHAFVGVFPIDNHSGSFFFKGYSPKWYVYPTSSLSSQQKGSCCFTGLSSNLIWECSRPFFHENECLMITWGPMSTWL
jgi:hypothetical protein